MKKLFLFILIITSDTSLLAQKEENINLLLNDNGDLKPEVRYQQEISNMKQVQNWFFLTF